MFTQHVKCSTFRTIFANSADEKCDLYMYEISVHYFLKKLKKKKLNVCQTLPNMQS